MKTPLQRSLPLQLARLALVLLCLSAVASLAGAEQIINQTFAVDSTPTGWVVQGSRNSLGNHTDAGTPMTNANLYGAAGTQNYLQLNGNLSWQRASAYYTGGTVNSRNFTLTANIYLGSGTSGADGLTFSFLNASTVHSNSDLFGGYGEWEGSPQGKTSGIQGYVAGIQGFNFEFDHYNNNEPSNEYTALVNVNNWTHYRGTDTTVRDFSGDSTFFYNTGWEQVQLRAWDGRMYFSYNYNGTTHAYDNSYNFALPADYTSYNAYFGVTAATGGAYANHWVSDVTLENSGSATPEPGSLVLYGLIGLGLP
ncbi:MAG: hypothetical protein WCP21_03705 [Armatimonadota bacterium]